MAKCQHNNVGSVVLHRPAGGSFRLWNVFSATSFRRKIIGTMRCGGGSCHRQDGRGAESPPERRKQRNQKQRSECGSESKKSAGSGTLSEFLRLSESSDASLDGETAEEVKRKVESLEEMKRAAKKLQHDDVLEGAIDVRRLTKENPEARTNLALLGAIPPLVALLDSEGTDSQIASLYALLNLGIGNEANKAAIVKAGAVHKMLKLIESPNGSPNPAVKAAIVANFLGLSALDSNKSIIGSSGAIPFLVTTLKNVDDRTNGPQAKQDSLRALYNLSISPLNIPTVVEADLIPFLLSALGDMEVSERILSILGNVVSTPDGRKAISAAPDSFPILVDVLNWTDSPGCQEKASYVLMVMAHKSFGDRNAMIEAGIHSSLLELTLLGSALGQKRASRILECLRMDKGKEVLDGYGGANGASVSAPICSFSAASADPDVQLKWKEGGLMSEERKAVKHLVQQSLQSNMRRIVKRANLPQDFVPSDHFEALTSGSTSMSLPF